MRSNQIPQYQLSYNNMIPNQTVINSSPQYINNELNVPQPYQRQIYSQPQYVQPGYPNQGYPQQVQRNGEKQELEVVWEKKFMIVHQRFEWEFQRFEVLRQEYEDICEQLNTVDSEEDWNQLKAHHAQLMDKFNELHDQLASVLNDNNQLASEQNLEFEQVWQQRYHELMANFNSLQAEMAEMQDGQSHKQNYDERRQEELANQYRHLEIKYENAIGELKAYQEKDPGSQVNEYREKLEYALEQGEKYKSILDKLHEENEEMQRIMSSLEEQNNALKRELTSRSKVNIDQYQNLLSITEQKEEELSQSRMEKEMTSRENKKLSEQLQIQMQEILQLRQIINRNRPNEQSISSSVSGEFNRLLQMKTDEIAEYKAMLRSTEEDFRVSLKDHEQTLVKKYEEKITVLKKENKRLEARLTQNQDTKPLVNAKVDSLQKKVAYYEKEVANFNQTLNKKNEELMQLRGLAFEIQKAKNFRKNYESLQKERDQQKQTIKSKTREVDQLKNTIFDLQTKLREITSKKADYSVQFLQDQIQSLKVAIERKQNQNNRNRQILQSKQNQIGEMRSEAEKSKAKLNAQQRNFMNQKHKLQLIIEQLGNRNKDYEKKLRHLEFQYGSQMKSNLETQINILRGQSQTKQDSITRLEAEVLQYRSRIVNLQRQKCELDNDNNELRGNIGEFQRWKVDYIKKMQQAELNLANREKQIQELQLNQVSFKGKFSSFKDQVNDHQEALKAKNIVIRRLEAQNQMLGREIDTLNRQKQNLKKDLKKVSQESRQQIFRVQESIKQGGNQGNYLYSSKTKSAADFENNSQVKMMAALKSQNERLKMQLARLFEIDFQNQKSDKQISQGGQGLNYIQKRLQQFNSKLTFIIYQQQSVNENRVFRDQGQRERENNENHAESFKNLKQKLINLQKYCASLQVKLGDNEVIQPNAQSAEIIVRQEAQLKQQINFYKGKAEDFQKRVDHLLMVNGQLKSRVECLLNDKNEFSSTNYYKEQASLAQKNNELLAKKIQKLTQDNRSLRKANIQIHSKVLFQRQAQIDELNQKIQELNRKIRQLELEKVSFGNQKASLSHDIRKQENQFKLAKNALEEKLLQYENHTNLLSNKINTYELQIKEINIKGSPVKQYRNSAKKEIIVQNQASSNKFVGRSALLRDFQSVL